MVKIYRNAGYYASLKQNGHTKEEEYKHVARCKKQGKPPYTSSVNVGVKDKTSGWTGG